jgi:hypothetical protein
VVEKILAEVRETVLVERTGEGLMNEGDCLFLVHDYLQN